MIRRSAYIGLKLILINTRTHLHRTAAGTEKSEIARARD